MKKFTSARLMTLTVCGLGFFTMLSLSSCDGAGEAQDQKEEKTEEAAPAEKENRGDHPSGDSEHPNEAEADTTDQKNEHPAGEDEHPSGSDEHPTGDDEHPN